MASPKLFNFNPANKVTWKVLFYLGDNEELRQGQSNKKQTRKEKMEAVCPDPDAKI